MKAELLAHLSEGKVRLCLDYSPREYSGLTVEVGNSIDTYTILEGKRIHALASQMIITNCCLGCML